LTTVSSLSFRSKCNVSEIHETEYKTNSDTALFAQNAVEISVDEPQRGLFNVTFIVIFIMNISQGCMGTGSTGLYLSFK